MKIVVDTNILFSFFWKKSITRKLLTTSNLELISPIITLKELEKYSKEIINKTNLTRKEFDIEINNLKEIINFIDKKDYYDFLKEAEKLSPDKGDTEFIALCLKYSCFLWSNDSLLKAQDKIRVLSTEEIIDVLF
ncbi:MAG: PIN domain-containing protein [Candidatus Pacearchaeota archaeon]